MNKKGEHLKHGGLLCRIPVPVRAELGPDITLPGLGASPRSQCSRLLGESLILQARPQIASQQGQLATGPCLLRKMTLSRSLTGMQGWLKVRVRGRLSMESKAGGKDKKSGKGWWYPEAPFCKSYHITYFTKVHSWNSANIDNHMKNF